MRRSLSDEEFFALGEQLAHARREVAAQDSLSYLEDGKSTIRLALAEARRDALAWQVQEEAKRRVERERDSPPAETLNALETEAKEHWAAVGPKLLAAPEEVEKSAALSGPIRETVTAAIDAANRRRK